MIKVLMVCRSSTQSIRRHCLRICFSDPVLINKFTFKNYQRFLQLAQHVFLHFEQLNNTALSPLVRSHIGICSRPPIFYNHSRRFLMIIVWSGLLSLFLSEYKNKKIKICKQKNSAENFIKRIGIYSMCIEDYFYEA